MRLQLQNGEVLACNGCHTPAGAQNTPAGQTPHSHGRANLFTAVYSGSTSGGPFPNANPAFSANSGETMAETRTRTNCKNSGTSWCALMNPSVDVVAAEVWANPPATTPDVSLRYADCVARFVAGSCVPASAAFTLSARRPAVYGFCKNPVASPVWNLRAASASL